MFGYIRPAAPRLSEAENERFRDAYCGLCHTLGRRYGFAARWLLNFDFTLLSILLSLGRRAVPYLKDGFLPDGMLEMARRAYWAARLAGAEENDWFLSILPVSQRDVREIVIAALGASQENAPLLLALRKNAAMTASWRNAAVRICPDPAAWRAEASAADLASWRIRAQCCGLPATLPFTEKTVTQ